MSADYAARVTAGETHEWRGETFRISTLAIFGFKT
jgi:hypothetical protein